MPHPDAFAFGGVTTNLDPAHKEFTLKRNQMRHLAQPEVVKSAGLAGFLTALACYPRFVLWLHRPDPVWFLEALLLPCAFVLWAFVFAWHTRYSHRPVFKTRPDLKLVGLVTLVAVISATILHFCLDPYLRPKMPEDYPVNIQQWLAMVLFSLSLQPLLLLFAPFAFFARLFKNGRAAINLTVFFGLIVLLLKLHSQTVVLPPLLNVGFMVTRVLTGFLALYFYLRGGVLLVYGWILIMQARHLLDLV